MNRTNKQQGFTLIELMIVVAVIGVLTAIAVPQYQTYVKKSELGSALATITALKVHVEDKIATDGEFPTVATADMATELGASVTILGDLSTQQGTTVQEGQIKIELATGTQVPGAFLALGRDSSGTWRCITDIAATEKKIFPKGCKNGTIL